MEISRWHVLAVGLLVERVGGILYAFSVYSPDLKSHFNMTQYELDMRRWRIGGATLAENAKSVPGEGM